MILVDLFINPTPELRGQLSAAQRDQVDQVLGELILQAVEENKPQLVENFLNALDLETVQRLAKDAMDWQDEVDWPTLFADDKDTWGPVPTRGAVEAIQETTQGLAQTGRRFHRHIADLFRALIGLKEAQQEVYGQYQAQQILLFYKQVAMAPVTLFTFLAIRMPTRRVALGATALIALTLAILARPLYHLLKEQPDFDKVDLVLKANDGKLNPVLGRTMEIDRLYEGLKLQRDATANPAAQLLLGGTGVGKSALVDGLAQRLATEGRDDVRILSLNAVVFQSFAMMNSAAMIEALQVEIDKQPEKRFVIFVDEIHGLPKEAMELFKSKMDRFSKRLTMIGATTSKEYDAHLKENEAFTRRFTEFTVSSLPKPAVIDLLERLLDGDEREWMISQEMLQTIVMKAEQVEKPGSLYTKARKLLNASLDHLCVEQRNYKHQEIAEARQQQQTICRQLRAGTLKESEAKEQLAEHVVTIQGLNLSIEAEQQKLEKLKRLRQMKIEWIRQGRESLHSTAPDQKLIIFALHYFRNVFPEEKKDFARDFPVEITEQLIDTVAQSLGGDEA